MSSRTQDGHAEQSTEQRRRKRKERAAKSRTPEPKDIVSGAGQPLDPGVRRDLEERLGHDLSRVRLHTGRDAGQLTELLGADAVAVGQDVFFAEGAFKPGTDEGRRLLAHELLHTVQNPHGLGTLRAGRELGAVSLPQQAIEREAEAAAEAVAAGPEGEGFQQAADVEEGQGTPGWLRYATVDADRRRTEQLDPATLVDRLANTVLRSLRGDPEDRSGRVRLQLARMSAQVQDVVFDRLEERLPAPVLDRLLEAVEETEQAGPLPMDAAAAPVAVPGASDEIAEERGGEQTSGERPEAGERQEDTGGRTQPGAEGEQKAGGEAAEPGAGGRADKPGDGKGSTAPEDAAAQDKEEADARDQDRSASGQVDKETSGRENKDAAAQDDRQKAEGEGAQKDGEKKDEAAAEEDREEAGSQDEAPQEPERQAGEQQARQAEEPVAANAAAAPSPVDRSGAEPGERPRTGGDTGTLRPAGDPENEQDADDDPLGLDSEPAEQESADDEDTPSARADEPVPDIDLVGYTEAARNPGLVEERKKGTAPRPALPSADAGPEPDAVADESRSAAGQEAPARSAADDGDQDLFTGALADHDLGPDGSGGGSTSIAAEASGLTSTPSESAAGAADRTQAERHAEDGEARRRDEEARTADGAGAGATSPEGEPAGPERLAKADEDARTQDAGPSQAAGRTADAGGKPESAGKQGSQAESGPEKSDTKPGGGSDKEASEPADKGEEKAHGGGTGGDSAPGTKPAPGSGDQDVTEGNGNATSPGPQTGPDKVSTPGPGSAPQLAPGNGPAPMSVAEAKTNAPRTASGSGAGGGSTAPQPKASGSKRQAARKVARNAGRGGGGRSSSTAAPAPARGGGGRAGASAPAKPKKEAAAPDVSNATPEAGLATAAGLKPHQMLDTLKGVNGAVGRSVDKERTALRKAPPKEQRPSGSPRTVPGGPTPAAPGTYTNAKVGRTEAAPGKTPEIGGEQKPQGEVPGANVPEPSWWDIAVTIGAQLFGKLLKEILPLDDLIDSILGLPTKDEGLKGAKVGDAPRLPLENDSDPQRTDEQGQKLDERKGELHRSGREDAARPMGEDQIYPDVPKETLTGKVPGGNGKNAKGGGRSVSSGVPIESASAVAEHDRGPQIQAGFGEGRKKMGQERRTKDDKAHKDRQKHDQDLRREVDKSSKQQSDTRDKGRSDIADSRERWRKEQDDKTAEIDGKKGKKYDEVRKDIDGKQEQTDKDVDKRTEDDNKKITDEETNAEKEAEKKQDEGKDDADNWLEEAIEKLKEFFEGLKNAIKGIFEKARQIVTDLIDKFKQQVFKLIDDARNWVIDKINKFADALIALGDELLADYPAMRDKWRRTIDGARDWAVEKVNQIADGLKEIAGKLLDGLCGALLAGLDLLETGLLAAVEVAESATVGALEFGAAVVEGLGEWAAIFNDIVSDPGDWISKAGAAAETGAKEHLFNEVTSAVKAWFNQKVQEIIGIPIEDFQELVSGGVTVEQMAQMAWDEALPQLPVIIGVLVVEKVVAKLIPGAGWVMAVIDALKTAWGALSEILAAFGLFMDFLKSVKSGNGALPFAKAVAAGVVALLELIYEFLIEGVGKFMGKVADKLGDMLKNLRKKKHKPDGSDGPPGQPNAPSKPKDQDSAPPTNDRSPDPDRPTDRPSGRDDDRPTPGRTSTDKNSRPPTRPRPGKRSAPEKKRPSHTTRPKKRRDDERRREEGREVNAARKRMRDAERRTRNDKDGTPDAPSRRRPDTDRTDSRGPGRGRPGDRRTDDARRPGDKRRADDKRTTDKRRTDDTRRPEDRRPDKRTDDRRDTDRNRDKDRRPGNRARQTIKSAVNRARRAAAKLSGKARRKLGNKLNDRLRRLRDQWRRRNDRDRTRDRDRMRDRDRRRNEDQEPEKNGRRYYDLPEVHFRTLANEEHTLLYNGRGRTAELSVRSELEDVQEYLDDWRKNNKELQSSDPERFAEQERFVRQAHLRRKLVDAAYRRLPERAPGGHRTPIVLPDRGNMEFRRQLEALRVQMEILADLLERRYSPQNPLGLPPTILPPFSDDTVARSFRSHYIKKDTPEGTEAVERRDAWPLGWEKITPTYSRGARWVRMHLLPARIGGHASTSNLVPATKEDNENAAAAVEHPAARSLGHVVKGIGWTGAGDPNRMIWYDVNITLRNDYPGFPASMTVTWGGYRQRNRSWEREYAGGARSGRWAEGDFDPPPWARGSGPPPAKANVNFDKSATIRRATGISSYFADLIAGLTKINRRSRTKTFNNMTELENALSSAGLAQARGVVIRKLKDAERDGKLFF
ncbi:eCIS core domain-containing protein [Streptomyces chartreusis]|uniref:eCIS core domain-containing protein n=1 Tax=Streptomyces chartreusis TaxID=1969 RepID=UPI003403F872